MTLVTRNYRSRGGEIDLVMDDDGTLVFVEVRFRKPGRFASAAATVDVRKQRRILSAARCFIARYRRYGGDRMRFDVVALDGPTVAESTLQWLRGAFRPRA